MLIDARWLPDGFGLDTDVCVVGAGPVGLAVALLLDRAGRSTVLVESGGWRLERQVDSLSSGELPPGSPHPPVHLYRPRVIGGGTSAWGGRCVPYDPIDFEVRDWIPMSGWPLAYGDLVPYYRLATRFCDAGEFAFEVATALGSRAPRFLPELDGTELETNGVERFSRPTNLGRRYRDELVKRPSLTVLHHASLAAVNLGHNSREVSSLTLRTLAGTELQVRPRLVVLAMGALETVRTLLASDDVAARGIGNEHDMLGRCYFSHLEATVGEFRVPGDSPVAWSYERSVDGVYVRRRMRVAASAQRRLGIGNAIARLHRPPFADPTHGQAVLSAAWFVKHLLPSAGHGQISWGDRVATARYRATNRDGFVPAHLRNLACGLPSLLGFAPWWLWRRSFAARKLPSLTFKSRRGAYPLCFNVEQAPNPDSRLTLNAARDRLGLPLLKVDWRACETDRRSIRGTLALVAQTVRDSGTGRFDYDEAEAVESFLPIGGHQLGGARMSGDPRRGVVDAPCCRQAAMPTRRSRRWRWPCASPSTCPAPAWPGSACLSVKASSAARQGPAPKKNRRVSSV
jgi:choline dehydrogenase-like flavoprotein